MKRNEEFAYYQKELTLEWHCKLFEINDRIEETKVWAEKIKELTKMPV